MKVLLLVSLIYFVVSDNLILCTHAQHDHHGNHSTLYKRDVKVDVIADAAEEKLPTEKSVTNQDSTKKNSETVEGATKESQNPGEATIIVPEESIGTENHDMTKLIPVAKRMAEETPLIKKILPKPIEVFRQAETTTMVPRESVGIENLDMRKLIPVAKRMADETPLIKKILPKPIEVTRQVRSSRLQLCDQPNKIAVKNPDLCPELTCDNMNEIKLKWLDCVYGSSSRMTVVTNVFDINMYHDMSHQKKSSYCLGKYQCVCNLGYVKNQNTDECVLPVECYIRK